MSRNAQVEWEEGSSRPEESHKQRDRTEEGGGALLREQPHRQ